MQERTIDIDTGEGAMETFITQPEAGGPFPAVIVYMDIWGVREELYDIARRIATAGYCGIVPDFYYRQGRKRFDTRGPGGKLMSAHLLEAAVRDEAVAVSRTLTDAMAIADTAANIGFLAGEADIRTDAMGSVGYCMGGRQVLAVAGHFPNFRATMSLTAPTWSPRKMIRRICWRAKCRASSIAALRNWMPSRRPNWWPPGRAPLQAPVRSTASTATPAPITVTPCRTGISTTKPPPTGTGKSSSPCCGGRPEGRISLHLYRFCSILSFPEYIQ